MLHTNASQVAALDLGFKTGGLGSSTPKLVYLLGAEDTAAKAKGNFVVYQGLSRPPPSRRKKIPTHALEHMTCFIPV